MWNSVQMNKPRTKCPGLIRCAECGYFRHHSRWSHRQFCFFFLGQDPKHFDAELTFLRRTDELDLLLPFLKGLNYRKRLASRSRPCTRNLYLVARSEKDCVRHR